MDSLAIKEWRKANKAAYDAANEPYLKIAQKKYPEKVSIGRQGRQHDKEKPNPLQFPDKIRSFRLRQ